MTSFRLSAIAAALLTAGCLSHPDPAPPPYRAVAQGTADWTLVIDDRNITFLPAGGAMITQPAPKPIIGFAGEIYQTPRINVNIVHQSCRDGRSDRAWPDMVQLSVDGRAYQGCGGL